MACMCCHHASLVLCPVQLTKETHHRAPGLATMQYTTCSFSLTEHNMRGLLLHQIGSTEAQLHGLACLLVSPSLCKLNLRSTAVHGLRCTQIHIAVHLPAECVKGPSVTDAIWSVCTPQHSQHRFVVPATPKIGILQTLGRVAEIMAL